MTMKTLTLAIIAAIPAPADAQQRTGGLALAGGAPALDVQAGPHGVRLSRTFGF